MRNFWLFLPRNPTGKRELPPKLSLCLFLFPRYTSLFLLSLCYSSYSCNQNLFLSHRAASSWTLDGDDLIEDDLIDEDNLLLEEDLSKPDTQSYDCGEGAGGVRKACKGCSCGLAEELDKEAAALPKKSAEKASACGNCYLGDAFRCATCPHLGKPAFKPGEQVMLDL